MAFEFFYSTCGRQNNKVNERLSVLFHNRDDLHVSDQQTKCCEQEMGLSRVEEGRQVGRY